MVAFGDLCACEKCESLLATSSCNGCHGVTVDWRAPRRLCGCYTVPVVSRRGRYEYCPGCSSAKTEAEDEAEAEDVKEDKTAGEAGRRGRCFWDDNSCVWEKGLGLLSLQ